MVSSDSTSPPADGPIQSYEENDPLMGGSSNVPLLGMRRLFSFGLLAGSLPAQASLAQVNQSSATTGPIWTPR